MLITGNKIKKSIIYSTELHQKSCQISHFLSAHIDLKKPKKGTFVAYLVAIWDFQVEKQQQDYT